MASWGSEVHPDPKPVKRHKASRKEQDALRARFEHASCVATGLPYQHLHHAVFRSEGGDDVYENMVPILNEPHERFHKRAPGWERVAAAIRVFVLAAPERRDYVLGKMGGFHFARRYPPLPNTDPQFEDDFRRIYSVHQTPKDAA